MRLSDIRDKKIRTVDGEIVGRVHEVHCDDGKVVALVCGAPSLIERLTATAHGRRVPWEDVLRIAKDAVVIGPKSASPRRRGA
jgi:sporulation protein YlmC with PRC-barrel domain